MNDDAMKACYEAQKLLQFHVMPALMPIVPHQTPSTAHGDNPPQADESFRLGAPPFSQEKDDATQEHCPETSPETVPRDYPLKTIRKELHRLGLQGDTPLWKAFENLEGLFQKIGGGLQRIKTGLRDLREEDSGHPSQSSSSSSSSGLCQQSGFDEEGGASAPEFPGLKAALEEVIPRLKESVQRAFEERNWPEFRVLTEQYLKAVEALGQ